MSDLSKVVVDLQIRIEHLEQQVYILEERLNHESGLQLARLAPEDALSRLESHVVLLEERLNYEGGMRLVELEPVGAVELINSESTVCSVNEETA